MTQQNSHLPKLKKLRTPSQLNQYSQQKQVKKLKIGSYIDDSLKNIEKGCYQEQKLCIDSGYGDYRMSIFRLKDKKKKFFQIPSIFTETFIKDMEKLTPQLKQQFHQIIKRKRQDYLENKQDTIVNQQHTKPQLAPYIGQDQSYLYHQYVPSYQKQRWFKKTISVPQQQPQKNQSILLQTKTSRKKRNNTSQKPTHFFRYLENKSIYFMNST